MKKTICILLLASLFAILVLSGCSTGGISGEKDKAHTGTNGEAASAGDDISEETGSGLDRHSTKEDDPDKILEADSDKNDGPDSMPEADSNIENEPDSMPHADTDKEDSGIFYFKEYRDHKSINNEILENVYLEAFDKDGNPVWNYSWENLRPTELNVASETVAYDGKVYKEVYGTLYCFDGKTGKKLWENSNDTGGGTVIYPYRERIYITSYYGNVLTCLDKDSGTRIWAIEDKNLYWGYVIFSHNDEIIVGYGDAYDGSFISVHYQDGRILDQWHDGVIPDKNIRWDRASASSVLEGNQARYGAMNIIDKNSATAWAEGADGYGINEWVQVERDGLVDIGKISISNGYHKSQDTYNNNGRLRRFRLDFSHGQYIYYEVDEREAESRYIHITFDRPVSTDFIKLTVLDAFEGSKYEDTCITDILSDVYILTFSPQDL